MRCDPGHSGGVVWIYAGADGGPCSSRVVARAAHGKPVSLRKESRYLGATYGKAIAPLGLRGTQPGTSPQNTAGHDEPGLTATDQ